MKTPDIVEFQGVVFLFNTILVDTEREEETEF
jgi:hypothetical protein